MKRILRTLSFFLILSLLISFCGSFACTAAAEELCPDDVAVSETPGGGSDPENPAGATGPETPGDGSGSMVLNEYVGEPDAGKGTRNAGSPDTRGGGSGENEDEDEAGEAGENEDGNEEDSKTVLQIVGDG